MIRRKKRVTVENHWFRCYFIVYIFQSISADYFAEYEEFFFWFLYNCCSWVSIYSEYTPSIIISKYNYTPK